jgi:signal transduction histidine kinase
VLHELSNIYKTILLRLFFFGFIWVAASQVSLAQVEVVALGAKAIQVGELPFELTPYSQWLAQAPGPDYSLGQLDSLAQVGAFRHGPLAAADSLPAYWLRFELNNHGQETAHYYLRPNQRTLNLLYPRPPGLPQQSGLKVLFPQASLPFLSDHLALNLPSGRGQVFYLKISSPYQNPTVGVQLLDYAETDQWIKRAQIEDWVLAGTLSGMLLYNLLLFGLLKGRSYLFYSLYNLGAVGWICCDTFFAFWPPEMASFYLEVPIGRGSIVLFQFAYLGFVRHYFQAPQLFPDWNQALKWLQWAYLFPIVILGLEAYQQQFIASEWFLLFGGLIASVSSFGLGVWAWRKDYSPAKYYLAASALLLVGVFVIVGGYLTDPSGLFLKRYGATVFKFALMVESVLFAFALASRYNLLKAQVEQKRLENEALAKHQQAAIQAMIEQKNQELELKVVERTRDLTEANEAKDRLMGIISHDLRSPVASVQLALSVIGETELPDGMGEMVDELGHEVAHLRQTIDNLLNWAYAQRQGIVTQPTALDLEILVEEKITLLRPLGKKKGIEIYSDLTGPLLALADPQQVRLVLHNLIGNALKFTHPGGGVHVSGRRAGGCAEVRIADNGTGISPENLARLFNLTTHFTERGTSGESGTGLGLLLCKEMVERNGGTIGVESEPGKGSTFWFTLPVAQAQQPE